MNGAGEPVEPTIGSWYADARGRRFEVVAVDEAAGTVEVQFFDGAVAEYDMESWNAMLLEAIAAPEDWTGPYDDLEADDLGDTERPKHPEDWDGPWNELDQKD